MESCRRRMRAAEIVGALDLRRRGGEHVGACPNCRDGRDRFHVRADGVFGCRVCGEHDRAGLYRAVMDACGYDTWRPSQRPATRRRPEPKPNAGPGLRDVARAAWRAATGADQSPGHLYLRGRGVWPSRRPLPDAVRWLDAARAPVGMRRALASVAGKPAGFLLYRYATATDAAVLRSIKAEAIGPGFEGRLRDAGGGVFKRNYGARDGALFVAIDEPGGSWHLCEGEADALAVASTFDAGRVVCASGSSGWTVATCADAGERRIVLHPDRDGPGLAGRASAVACRRARNNQPTERQGPGRRCRGNSCGETTGGKGVPITDATHTDRDHGLKIAAVEYAAAAATGEPDAADKLRAVCAAAGGGTAGAAPSKRDRALDESIHHYLNDTDAPGAVEALRAAANIWDPNGAPPVAVPVKRLEAEMPDPLIRYAGRPGPDRRDDFLLHAGSVLAVAGAGGVGKSRLALQLALTAAGGGKVGAILGSAWKSARARPCCTQATKITPLLFAGAATLWPAKVGALYGRDSIATACTFWTSTAGHYLARRLTPTGRWRSRSTAGRFFGTRPRRSALGW